MRTRTRAGAKAAESGRPARGRTDDQGPANARATRGVADAKKAKKLKGTAKGRKGAGDIPGSLAEGLAERSSAANDVSGITAGGLIPARIAHKGDGDGEGECEGEYEGKDGGKVRGVVGDCDESQRPGVPRLGNVEDTNMPQQVAASSSSAQTKTKSERSPATAARRSLGDGSTRESAAAHSDSFSDGRDSAKCIMHAVETDVHPQAEVQSVQTVAIDPASL